MSEFRSHRRAARGPFGNVANRLLNLFSSVWTGITLAVLLFVYCSIGSAVPQVRQHWALEMTEFQWFHWWPFNVLILLLVLTMVTVTIRRIPFRLVNAGVWTIHSGIIVLVVGSFIYFTTKIEGDGPVFRRRVRIEHSDMIEPAHLLALPGNQMAVPVGPDLWRFLIQSTNSAWPILSEPHRGEKAYAVNVLVTPPDGEPFIRQLLAGYPQYTEDVIPGKGRAIKAVGTKLVDEQLALTLDYEPQTWFHVMDTWALYVRRVGETEWVQRPIRGLPRYHDRIGSRDQVFTDPHFPIQPRTLDVVVSPPVRGDALSAASVHVTGYLRYARLQRRWRNDGGPLNPVLRVALLSDHARGQTFELAALDPRHNAAADGSIQFVWLDDAAELADLPGDSRPMLTVEVPEAHVSFEVAMTRDRFVGADGPYTPIEGTDFAYRIRNVHDHLSLPNVRSQRGIEPRTVSVAVVEIKTPQGEFTRWVADRPEMTRDMHGADADPHASDPNVRRPDSRIVMHYRPGASPILFAGYPGGLQFLFNDPAGGSMDSPVKIGEVIEMTSGLSIRIEGYWTHARSEVKPYVVPPPARQRDAGEVFAMIRLEVDSGSGVQARWLSFHPYVFPNEQYAYRGRFTYAPERFRAPDGTGVELIFSRERRKLPAPIALEAFELDTHVGGYTGSVSTIRNYVSRLRFAEDGQWGEPVSIAVNHPVEYGGYWYFQSTWDKPSRNDPNGGTNYTGLGVGNRRGVYIQLAGCCLAVSGMIFAFYVKPVLKRRRAARSRARIGQKGQTGMQVTMEPAGAVQG